MSSKRKQGSTAHIHTSRNSVHQTPLSTQHLKFPNDSSEVKLLDDGEGKDFDKNQNLTFVSETIARYNGPTRKSLTNNELLSLVRQYISCSKPEKIQQKSEENKLETEILSNNGINHNAKMAKELSLSRSTKTNLSKRSNTKSLNKSVNRKSSKSDDSKSKIVIPDVGDDDVFENECKPITLYSRKTRDQGNEKLSGGKNKGKGNGTSSGRGPMRMKLTCGRKPNERKERYIQVHKPKIEVHLNRAAKLRFENNTYCGRSLHIALMGGIRQERGKNYKQEMTLKRLQERRNRAGSGSRRLRSDQNANSDLNGRKKKRKSQKGHLPPGFCRHDLCYPENYRFLKKNKKKMRQRKDKLTSSNTKAIFSTVLESLLDYAQVAEYI